MTQTQSSDWNSFQIPAYRLSYFDHDFSAYTFKYVNETAHFFPSLIPGCRLSPRLHDFGTKFHSGSSLRYGMKNGLNLIQNELYFNPPWLIHDVHGFHLVSPLGHPGAFDLYSR